MLNGPIWFHLDKAVWLMLAGTLSNILTKSSKTLSYSGKPQYSSSFENIFRSKGESRGGICWLQRRYIITYLKIYGSLSIKIFPFTYSKFFSSEKKFFILEPATDVKRLFRMQKPSVTPETFNWKITLLTSLSSFFYWFAFFDIFSKINVCC